MPKVSAEHSEQQRRKIVQAAMECFCRRGYHETSVQDICDAAGLSKGAVYTYFRSKEDILAAAIQDSFLGSVAVAREAAREGTTAVDRLQRAGDAVLAQALTGEPGPARSLLMLEIWAEASRNPMLRDLCARGYESWQAFLAGVLRDGIASGNVRADVDPDALASILMAVFDGLVLQESLTRSRVDWRRVFSTLRRVLAEGILADSRATEGSSP